MTEATPRMSYFGNSGNSKNTSKENSPRKAGVTPNGMYFEGGFQDILALLNKVERDQVEKMLKEEQFK